MLTLLSVSAQISPSREYVVAITRYGSAEIYSLNTRSAVGRLDHIFAHDPFPPFASAIFYGRNSLALCHAADVALEFIPAFNPLGRQRSFTLIVEPNTPPDYPPSPTRTCFKHLNRSCLNICSIITVRVFVRI